MYLPSNTACFSESPVSLKLFTAASVLEQPQGLPHAVRSRLLDDLLPFVSLHCRDIWAYMTQL